jgi:hypothetical protein
MSELNEDISELNNYLSSVLYNLENINDENFDSSVNDINSLIKEIENKKISLKNNFSLQSLKDNCDIANTTVKQIKLKFDYIIEAKKEKESSIVSELNKIANEKKLIKYKR